MNMLLGTTVSRSLKSHIKNTRKFNRTAFCSTALFAGTLALLFFPLTSRANNTEAIPAQSETTLTLSTSDINMTFGVDNINGTFSSSDPANITVNTNNYTGYTLNIANTTNDDNYNKLVNVGDNNYYFSSISSASTPEEFNANNWGILLDKTTGGINTTIDTTKYQPAPDLDGTTLDTTDRANNEPNTYDIKLGVKADYSARVGTYTNSFIITAVANPVGYTITYNKNTEEEVTNMPQEQIGDVGSSDVTISDNIPEREIADFVGWCSVATTDETCSATTYQPGDTITLAQVSNNNYDLYAMWKKTTINDLTYLQDFNSLSAGRLGTVMESMTTNDAYTLIDNRDNTTYHISKLADGRIWFLDNLALDLTNATVKSKLTPATTNATATSISKLINGGGTTSDQYATAGVSSTWSNSYSAPMINMASKGVVPANAPTNGKGNNKVGGYYNFCAASAGSYCYGDGSSAGTPSGNATDDICPAGWRMPTSYDTGEYQALATATIGSLPSGSINYSDPTLLATFRTTLSLPFSGFIYSGSASAQGTGGYFWASTRQYNEQMYVMYVYTSLLSPSGSRSRSDGYTVRCIAKTPDISIIYNANGGTGEMAKQTITDAQIIAGASQLNSNTFTKVGGYTFVGWNTKPDGSGTSYSDGATYTSSSTTLYAQWKTNVTITYNANGGTGEMANQTIIYPGNNLSTSTLTRSGYYFVGWNTKADGTGNKYADGSLFYEETPNITLYAQWTATSIQSINTSNCPTTATAVYDTRDNTVYNIQKLADGKCWMLDNLALDLTDSTVKSRLSTSNTNATATSISRLLNGGGTTSDQYATAGVSNWTSSYSYSAPLVNMASKDVVSNNAPSGGKGYNKVGGYYNFCAASAGSYCYGNGTSVGTSSGNATEDICPAGWRMPTSSTTGEYSALANIIYGSTGSITDATAIANYRNALSLPLSGWFYNGSAGSQGSTGGFWSSTRTVDNVMYSLNVFISYVDPSNGYSRYYGTSVRCIAK